MKSRTYFNLGSKVATLLLLLSLMACSSISSFDHYAYTQTTSLKVDALTTMSLASSEYKQNEKAIQELQIKLQKAYEYERNRPKNEISVQLWDKLLDINGHLLGGFIKRWQDKTVLSETFISEEKKLVGDAFDQISGLESHKIKATDVKNN